MSRIDVDVAIVGSGFSGSILAWILARQGQRVALIDAARHPRFAIGESSTPIADAMLRQLGATYRLQPLESLSRWRSWQADFPQLGCGLKRGFTYFQHKRDETCFCEEEKGQRSMWVAASPDDAVSDTHWYRPDVDTFFYQQAIECNAIDRTGYAVKQLGESKHGVTLQCEGKSSAAVVADFVVDASGQAAATAKLRNLTNHLDRLQTSTQSTFAHFTGVGNWSPSDAHRLDLNDVPFDADDSAQHHLIENGWVWMLRFGNGITSIGVTGRKRQSFDWSRLPVLAHLMKNAKLVAPVIAGQAAPRSTGRLQQLYDPWPKTARRESRVVMMPTTAATLDPLHSTGIAHALSGVQRLAEILSGPDRDRSERLQAYRSNVLGEISFLDDLISTAYAVMADFEKFTYACMAYFVAAIACEERLLRGEWPKRLWNADDAQFCQTVKQVNMHLRSRDPLNKAMVRDRLQPWNQAGLFDPLVANRYAYTATKT